MKFTSAVRYYSMLLSVLVNIRPSFYLCRGYVNALGCIAISTRLHEHSDYGQLKKDRLSTSCRSAYNHVPVRVHNGIETLGLHGIEDAELEHPAIDVS